MKTEQIFTFVVRSEFGFMKENDIFKAAVRTYVEDLVEKQDFILEDGRQFRGIPCKCTQFCEKKKK